MPDSIFTEFETGELIMKIKTVQIVLFINGRELMRNYALSEEGLMPDGMQENLQEMVDALVEIEE